MKRNKRWLSLVLGAVLTASLAVPSFAAPATAAFSNFYIDASDMAFSQTDLSVQIYSRDGSGRFQPGDVVEIDCSLNQVTEDASFYIQPKVGSVWVTLDYLTDLNGDGIYELPRDDTSPVWEHLSPQSSVILQRSAISQKLLSGQTYILSAQTLLEGSQQAASLRTLSGSSSYLGLSGTAEDFPLCLVSLHTSSGGEEQVMMPGVKEN